MPNNREWAILLWLAVGLIWLLRGRKVRSDAFGLLKSFLTPKIFGPFLGLLGYITLEIWLASKTLLWDSSLTKDAIIWTITTGVVLFFNFAEASKRPQFFRRRLLTAFEIVVFLEVFTNLFVLSLPAELVLQPILVMLGLLSAAAPFVASRNPAREDSYLKVGRFMTNGLAVAGFSLLLFSIVQLLANWNSLDKGNLAQQFALPVWLTIGVLPYVYFLSVYANYDTIFNGIRWGAPGDGRARLRAKLAIVLTCHLRARQSGAISFGQAGQIARHATSFREARRSVRQAHQSRQDAERAVIEEQQRLKRYAGSDGTDETGRRLDRREFKETTKALRWLATCQMGWYRNQSERYHADLLERLGDNFSLQKLTQPSGIQMAVSDDDQTWYAWRRTVTGWCFAIGAAGPPPNQWLYDGSEPPGGFPGDHPSWGSAAFSDEASLNWSEPPPQAVAS